VRATIGKLTTTTLMRAYICAVISSSLHETNLPACTPQKEERRSSKETHTAEAFKREAASAVPRLASMSVVGKGGDPNDKD
jgi:hypothetical protein